MGMPSRLVMVSCSRAQRGGSGVNFFPSRDSSSSSAGVTLARLPRSRARARAAYLGFWRRLQDPGPFGFEVVHGIRGGSATRLLARFAAQRWRSLRQPLLSRLHPLCKTRRIITLQARATACGRNYLDLSCAGVRFALGTLVLMPRAVYAICLHAALVR
jgi:hypothetical protein